MDAHCGKSALHGHGNEQELTDVDVSHGGGG